jgi:hypothetical protein
MSKVTSKKTLMNDEQLKSNLEAIFRYARIQSVTHNDSEKELIAIIQCKEETMNRLFPEKKDNSN